MAQGEWLRRSWFCRSGFGAIAWATWEAVTSASEPTASIQAPPEVSPSVTLPNVPLTWESDGGCDPPTSPMQMLERLLGPEGAAGIDRGQLRAFVRSHRDENGFVVDLRMVSRHGDEARTLRSASCEDLQAAVLLVIAVAFDPIDVVSHISTPVGSEAPPMDLDVPSAPTFEPATEEPPPPGTSTSSREADRGPWFLGASALFGAAYGPTPVVTPIFGLGLITGRTRAGLELDTSYQLHRSLEAGGGTEVRVWTLSWTALGCFAPTVQERFEVRLCLGAELGFVRASGSGLDEPGDQTIMWATIPGSAQVRVRIHEAIGLALRVDGFAALTQPIFTVDAGEEVYRALPAGVRGWLALDFRFRLTKSRERRE